MVSPELSYSPTIFPLLSHKTPIIGKPQLDNGDVSGRRQTPMLAPLENAILSVWRRVGQPWAKSYADNFCITVLELLPSFMGTPRV